VAALRVQDPFVVYLVQKIDEQDGTSYQLAGFTTELEAAARMKALEFEGWRDLNINTVPIHERLGNWE
jgi:hypothetical protein